MSTGNAEASGPLRAERLRGLLQTLDRAGCERDASARSVQRLRDAQPDAAIAADHECRAAIEAEGGEVEGHLRGRYCVCSTRRRIRAGEPQAARRIPSAGDHASGPQLAATSSGSALSRIIRKCGRQSGSADELPCDPDVSEIQRGGSAAPAPARRLAAVLRSDPCGARPGLAQSGGDLHQSAQLA